MIRDNACGQAVPPESPEAFADALQHLADHREELPEMGRRARTLAEREFDRSQLAARFVSVLEQAGSGQ